MAMTVLSEMSASGPAFFFTQTWRLLVESHLTWLRARNESDIVVIQPHIGYKYEGDLYGALTECRVPQYLHWIIMRMNGLYSPSDFNGTGVSLMVPTIDTVQQLAAVANTTQKKIA
jgi:hypothetical protein